MPATPPDLNEAADAWGANCGPAALAAILGKSLAEVRPHLGDFERRHYMNPTQMLAALASLGKPAVRGQVEKGWGGPGLALIQWHGPWLDPGVPAAAAYRHTHWIAVASGAHQPDGQPRVYDVNLHRWVTWRQWEERVPAMLTEDIRGATGAWSIKVALTAGGQGG